jgi:hypothetical protein
VCINRKNNKSSVFIGGYLYNEKEMGPYRVKKCPKG